MARAKFKGINKCVKMRGRERENIRNARMQGSESGDKVVKRRKTSN